MKTHPRHDEIAAIVKDEMRKAGLSNRVSRSPGNASRAGTARPASPVGGAKGRRVTVMGGGHGGLATAGHLSLKGFDVCLFSFYEQEIAPVRERGGVEMLGDVQGFGAIRQVTTSIDVALNGADVIILVYPALVHAPLAAIVAGALEDGQIIFLTPGRTGGALEFSRTLKRFAAKTKVYLAECQTFMYAVEKRGDSTVEVAKEKLNIRVSALPATDNAAVIPVLQELYPQITPARNVLETSLNNIGAILHPAPTLLNLAAIERAAAGETVRHYRDLITKSICELVLEPMDAEKVAVAEALGVEAWSAIRWFKESYGVQGATLHETLMANPYYADFAAPTHFLGYHHVLDEVPNSLVPIVSIGELVGVETPTIRSIIDLASVACGFNFWEVGRTLSSLGVGHMSPKELLQYVENSSTQGKCADCGLCTGAAGAFSGVGRHCESRPPNA